MEFFLPAIVSFVITLLTIPPTIFFAKKFNLLDNPKLRPHPAHTQDRIVPRAGGLPVFLAIILTLIFTPFEKTTLGILVGLVILIAIGLLDDKYKNFSPYLRLAGQFIAAISVVAAGVGINFITNPLGGIFQLDSLPFLPAILATFWIVWVMNMINWSKGVDGQMPGVVIVAAVILGLQDPMVARLAFAVAGASLGLLIFNWHPAKIFPGFSGSCILGFMIAVLAILSGAKLLTAGLVLLIPATDFAYTFLRRILQGKSPVWGDRGHLHHKLLEKGFTHSQIAYVYIFGSVMLGLAALKLSSQGKIFAASLVALVILAIILWLNFFGGLSKQQEGDNG